MSDQTPAKDLLTGTPFALVWPEKSTIDLPAVDGRTAALRILRRYLAELTFHLPGAKGSGKTVSLRIPEERIHVEQPDKEVMLLMGTKENPVSVVFLPGPAEYQAAGLATSLVENSKDKFGPGTALQVQSTYREVVTVEFWTIDKPHRRAVLAGFESALSPTEQMYGLRFRMNDYYGQTVCFSLEGGMRPDDPDNARNRRWGYGTLEMTYDVVRVVRVGVVDPKIDIAAFDFGTIAEAGSLTDV